jgi:hypothetical protein
METIETRCKRSSNWLKYYKKLYLLKDKRGIRIYKTNQSLFIKRAISSGIEGVVYKTHFRNKTGYEYKRIRKIGYFVTKALYLKRIRENKRISDAVFDADPDTVYELFYSKRSFDKPSLIEMIALSLTNELVCQKISPHYCLNYHWDYNKNVIRLYNEYASGGDFSKWAAHNHSIDVWYNAIFQIFIGILAIRRYFNMVHTDLHIKNILVHKVQPGGYWTYLIDDKKYHVPNLGFVFVLSDFGFTWIPTKIAIPWHYDQRLRYVTTRGQNYYDIAVFVKSLFTLNNVPEEIKKILNDTFKKTDFLVFNKAYYAKHYNRKNLSKKQKVLYKYLLNNYSKLKKQQQPLEYKINKMFQSYHTKPKEHHIETYSLNKRLKKNRLHKVFRSLVL